MLGRKNYLHFGSDAGGQRAAVPCDGQQVLDLLATESVDLVLMDCQMPILDGLGATRQIRALPNGASVPIIALTANVFAADRQQCIDAGMSDFLPKPVDPDALYALLAKYLPATNTL